MRTAVAQAGRLAMSQMRTWTTVCLQALVDRTECMLIVHNYHEPVSFLVDFMLCEIKVAAAVPSKGGNYMD